MNGIQLFGRFMAVHLKGVMGYKTSFFLTMIGQFLASFNLLVGIYFMFQRFHRVEGFSYSEVLLCFGIVLMQFSIAECFVRGFDSFSSMVREGKFDRLLVRPRGLVLQVLGSNFEFTRIGRMLQAVVMFCYGVFHSSITWNLAKVLTVFFMLIGGVALFSGLFLLSAALCFFTLDALEVMNIFTDGGREFGRYPVSIYGKRVLQFCTFVIPYALVQYYPLLYLLDRRKEAGFVVLPLLALLFLLPCYGCWQIGLKKYQSAGS